MKKFVLICFCVLSSVGGYAQNWDINTLHKINSLVSLRGIIAKPFLNRHLILR